MAKIISTAKAIPPYKVDREIAKEYTYHHFKSKFSDIDRLVQVFESSRIDSRYFCVPKEWFFTPKCFQEKNDTYIEWATRLSAQASQKCLDSASLTPQDVDYIIFVSTTGLSTPSIDARLINILHMRSDIKRTPIWGLGCVGGAAGLSMAFNHIKAFPDSKVLLVAVELCGLTFNFNDLSKSNLVATAIFADGAAAVLLGSEGDGPEIQATQSTIWPDSLDVMGWNFHNEGMQVVFARAIPAIVHKYARENISSFLGKHDSSIDKLDYFLIHPGGARVVDAYKESLGLNEDKLKIAENVLRENGNMSSVTILYILDEFLKTDYKKPRALGLMTALGPGFSSESLLFKT
jgi:alkylresorcinol/alkylpyrone synthase